MYIVALECSIESAHGELRLIECVTSPQSVLIRLDILGAVEPCEVLTDELLGLFYSDVSVEVEKPDVLLLTVHYHANRNLCQCCRST